VYEIRAMKALHETGLRKGIGFLGEQAWRLVSSLCPVPQLRVLLLRLLGARIGPNSIIHDARLINLYRGSFRNLRMGAECFIGQECLLDMAAPVALEDRVTLGQRVVIQTHMNVGYADHPLQEVFPAKSEGVSVGANVFIGTGSVILDGVTIGAGTFVAAGAVVSESLPSSVLAGGVPARVVRRLGVDRSAGGDSA